MRARIILGLGAGHCGLNVLADILGHQPQTVVTLEQPPLLPWQSHPGRPAIRERLERWQRQHPAAERVGDVAAFYLPHLEEAIAACPDLRAVCLRRPRAEIVAAYIRHLDQPGRPRLDHWSNAPEAGWTQDLVWTPTFPQFDVPNRDAGLTRYVDEYYQVVEEIAARHPENVRLIDTGDLADSEVVRQLLDFVGVPRDQQILAVARPPASAPEAAASPAIPRDPMDPRRCAILVPHSGMIHQECDTALRQLERRGYEVRRVAGYAAIDQGRNQIATDALRDGFEETLWIDSDIGFDPDAVETLRAHALPMVCGIYPQKGKRAIACHVVPGAPRMTFGKTGGLVELLYAATGFLLIRRQVYLDVARKLALPVCNERFGSPMLPFFLPMIRPSDDGHWYLAEDYAFCERARQAGYRIYGDTTIRLWHIGNYRYGWEDSGREQPRFDNFTLNFPD